MLDSARPAVDVDPGGWSGWQEIEVEPPELPDEDPAISDDSDSDEDMIDKPGELTS